MRIRVRDTTLFVDIEGLQLVPSGLVMRERPTVVLLHGGPGLDHSQFKPEFSKLAEVAQVVYVDQRGHGRSDPCAPEQWNLATWADDLRALCDILGIVKPIVLGVSFGGFVTLTYALRHPDHPGKLVLSNTRAHTDVAQIGEAFARLGGPQAGDAARRFWAAPGWDTFPAYVEKCIPLYMAQSGDDARHARMKADFVLTLEWSAREHVAYDVLADLHRVRCPTLVLAGENDPVCPLADVERMVAALPPELVTFRRFAGARHGLARELGDTYMEVVREFVTAG